MYKYYQPNKKDITDKVGDCSIRAFCKALDMEWLDVFDFLVPYARKAQCLLNQKPCYEKALNDLGWSYCSIPKGTKVTVEQMAKKNKETIICYVRVGYSTHLVTAAGGDYFDTWNCGSKLMYGYYIKNT